MSGHSIMANVKKLLELFDERDQLRARVAELEAERDRYKSLATRLCVDHRDYGAGEALAEIQAEAQRMGLYGKEGE